MTLLAYGPPLPLHDCPPGPFAWAQGDAKGRLGFMTEGADEYGPVAFSETGERVPMGRLGLAKVQPLRQTTTDEGG